MVWIIQAEIMDTTRKHPEGIGSERAVEAGICGLNGVLSSGGRKVPACDA